MDAEVGRNFEEPQYLARKYPCLRPEVVSQARRNISSCISDRCDKIVVIVGPCSIHDPTAALEYARRLKLQADRLEELIIVMRVYVEKPRTTVGWKGLIRDPLLDGSCDQNAGHEVARKLMRDINALGIPIACEFVDPLTPYYISDFVSWAAVGARSVESQTHREMASVLDMPVGFKNATSGDVEVAIQAVVTARSAHRITGLTPEGKLAAYASKGNINTHLVLRGGKTGPNYSRACVKSSDEKQAKHGLDARIFVDCSHGNSEKYHRRQPGVLRSICEQIKCDDIICGVMIESNLFEGSQDLPSPENLRENLSYPKDSLSGPHDMPPYDRLKYGVSITDSCVDWETTVAMLDMVAEAVRHRLESRKVLLPTT